MNFEEAKTLLNSATRWELRDHAFGDCEFGWNDAQGKVIAGGYSGDGRCDVWIHNEVGFTGKEASELKKLGTLGPVERNDETGPDDYVEDRVMPGLTKEAVLDEITKERE